MKKTLLIILIAISAFTAEAQTTLHDLFEHGVAWIATDTVLVAYGHKNFGRPCGLFITSAYSMDTMLAKAKTPSGCYDVAYIEHRLGIDKNGWHGKALIRYDIDYYHATELQLHWVTPPDAKCAGNPLYIPGANMTSGGMPEAFIGQVPYSYLSIEPKVLITCP